MSAAGPGDEARTFDAASPSPAKGNASWTRADRDEFFANLVISAGLTDREALAAARRRAEETSKSLADVLVESRVISEASRQALDVLVEERAARRTESAGSQSGQSTGANSSTVNYSQAPADATATYLAGDAALGELAGRL